MRYLIIIFLFYGTSGIVAQDLAPVASTSKVNFKIKNFGATVDGHFNGLKGNIRFDENSILTAEFNLTVDAATVDTGIGLRDNHLRKSEYFSVKEFPVISFISTKVSSAKAGEGTITGKLTIKKTTKEISFPFKYVGTGGTVRFSAEFQINRRDFQVGGGSLTLSNEVRIILDVTASK